MDDSKKYFMLVGPKGDEEKLQFVTGIVLEPDIVDAQNDTIDLEVVERAFQKWQESIDKPDPTMEAFREKIGAKQIAATFMSEPLQERFQQVQQAEKTMEWLIDWIMAEKKVGRLHVIHMRVEKE